MSSICKIAFILQMERIPTLDWILCSNNYSTSIFSYLQNLIHISNMKTAWKVKGMNEKLTEGKSPRQTFMHMIEYSWYIYILFGCWRKILKSIIPALVSGISFKMLILLHTMARQVLINSCYCGNSGSEFWLESISHVFASALILVDLCGKYYTFS